MSRHPHADARRILVTGVGGAPGFELARRLMSERFHVIAVDSHPLAAGLLLDGVTARVVPPADAADYSAQMLCICHDLEPEAIMPTVESELGSLISLSGVLLGMGVRTWLPSAKAVDACADKAAFHEAVSNARVPTPRTFLPHQLDEIPDGMPLIVKPRRGQGARNVHLCATRRQAALLCELVPAPLVQELVTGQEFTADCLVDRRGRASVILRQRLLVRNGLAMVAITFHDDEVTDLVKATIAAVGITGLCCAQGFICNSGPRRLVVTEMNARVAGAFPISEAAGADLVGQTLNGLFDLPVNHARLAYRPGVRLTKYVETLAVRDVPIAGPAGRPCLP